MSSVWHWAAHGQAAAGKIFYLANADKEMPENYGTPLGRLTEWETLFEAIVKDF